MAIRDIYSPAGTLLSLTHTDPQFGLGQQAEGAENSRWVYCQADGDGVTGEGYVVLLDEDFAADMIDTSNSDGAFGQRVAVAATAVGANEYFWAQIRGKADIRVAASAAANTTLNTTGTAGEIDDDATNGAEEIDGLILTTANGGAAGTAEGILNDPTVGVTLSA